MGGREDERDAPGGLSQLIGRVRGVAEHEPWRSWPLTVPGQRVHEHPGAGNPLGELGVLRRPGPRGKRDE